MRRLFIPPCSSVRSVAKKKRPNNMTTQSATDWNLLSSCEWDACRLELAFYFFRRLGRIERSRSSVPRHSTQGRSRMATTTPPAGDKIHIKNGRLEVPDQP